jgi:hypothetical protein
MTGTIPFLGPLQFEQVGTVGGSVRLRFQREHLMACPSAQLQCVGQLCGDNFAGVHAQPDTIQFVVKHDRPATDVYQLQILTVVEAAAGYRGATVEVGQYKGTAGHVLLKYRSGGIYYDAGQRHTLDGADQRQRRRGRCGSGASAAAGQSRRGTVSGGTEKLQDCSGSQGVQRQQSSCSRAIHLSVAVKLQLQQQPLSACLRPLL